MAARSCISERQVVPRHRLATDRAERISVDNWTRAYPAHTLTSLVCGQQIVGVDLDELDPERAEFVQRAAFRYLGVTPFIRVGRHPKRLLVYRQAWERPRTARETAASIRSETFRFADGGGLVEILSQGRQFAAFGIHPETGAPYQWIGDANPMEDAPDEAPLVTQDKIDAFIAAAHAEIAPFVVNVAGKPSAADAAREINSQGLISDGRESFLRDCIWQAANEIATAGDLMTAENVAARGWDLFVARAVTGDGKWGQKDALAKARITVRRIASGRVSLGSDMQEAAITFATPLTGATARQALAASFLRFARRTLQTATNTILELINA